MAKQITQKFLREPVFQAEADLTFVIDGEAVKDTYTFFYRGVTARVAREVKKAIEENPDRDLACVQLSVIIQQIKDVDEVDEQGNVVAPLPMTVDFFEGLLVATRDAFVEAIEEDVAGPKATPSDSAQNG